MVFNYGDDLGKCFYITAGVRTIYPGDFYPIPLYALLLYPTCILPNANPVF